MQAVDKMEVDIRLAAPRGRLEASDSEVTLVTPGDVITSDSGFMRGHGTVMEGDSLKATVAGVVQRVNRLVSVRPLKARYVGEIGDVVIGRVIEVGTRRWKVDVHTKLDAVLMLSSVNLPGGELRRRSEEDERMMRHYLQEGDLISAEVQNVMSDGTLSLHTRSLKYGKLGQGVLLQVPASLVKRRKTHFHTLPCGVKIILGNNGYIWLTPTSTEESNTGGYTVNLSPVPRSDREEIARLSNCVLALAEHKMLLFDTSIMYAYEESLRFESKMLLKVEVAAEIAELCQQRLEQEGYK
ncbi:exosome complex component RRP4-like [Babylonia areolata]|uniref:exosome complex component RRP4-like n=1 Tax=Babylonia areolata TaxID=304850 RepID=UPI003FD5F123